MTIEQYRSAIRSAARGLWSGALDYNSFTDAMWSAIERRLTQAFQEGTLDCGIRPDEYTFEEQMALRSAIVEQRMFVGGFAEFIEQNSKAIGGKWSVVDNRVEIWALRYNEVRERAKGMACADYKAVWVYGDTIDHCLPGTTMILTSNGEKRIDSILPGEHVLTRKGWQAVKDVFKHNYSGLIVNVEVAGRRLTATSDHLIMTQRGWTRAQDLIAGQDIVLFQDFFDSGRIHITAPNPFHNIAASCKIGISRLVSPLLGFLAFCKRLKSRMAVPVIPISFNNQIVDSDINNEFVFDYDLSIKDHAKRVKNTMQFSFQSAGVLSLIGMAGKRGYALRFFGMGLSPLSKCLGIARIVFGHPFLRSIRLSLSRFSLCKARAICGNYALDRCKRAAHDIGNFLRSMGAEKLTDIVDFFFRQCIPVSIFSKFSAMQLRPASTGTCLFPNWSSVGGIVNNIRLEQNSTDGTFSVIKSSGFISANRATESLRWWQIPTKWLTTVFADKIPQFVRHYIAPLYHPTAIISHSAENASLTVYNLKIDGLPEFFANGILVHNCEDCSYAEGRVYRLSIWEKYGYVPGSSELACGGWRCKCQRVQTDEPVTPGRPRRLRGA